MAPFQRAPRVRFVFLGIALFILLLNGPTVLAAEFTGLAPSGFITAYVDPEICATFAPQCVNLFKEPALEGNRNPIRIVLQVANPNGFPAENIPPGWFRVYTRFVPGLGPQVVQKDCPTCFEEAGGGTYSLYVEPEGDEVWVAGSYFLQVGLLLDGSLIQPAVVTFRVPFPEPTPD